MRYVLAAIIIVVQLASSFGNMRSLQSMAVDQHEITYRSLIEQRNLLEIHAHNKMPTKFQLAANQFLSLTSDEFASKMGSSFDKGSLISINSPPSIGASITISSSFVVDWWKNGKISPIKNQGSSCSSCYAFTAIADI